MKTIITSLFRGLAVASVLCVSSLLHAVEVGKPAPDFTLKDFSGQAVTLSALKGKTVVLEWVNPECPFVVKHYEKSTNMPDLQKAAAADGVVWISINTAADGKQGGFPADKVAAWSKKTGAAPAHYLRDLEGTVGRLYGAKTTPHMFVINPEGVLVYNGAIDSIRSASADDIAKSDNYVKLALAAVKEGKLPEKSVTQPYGCSVKY